MLVIQRFRKIVCVQACTGNECSRRSSQWCRCPVKKRVELTSATLEVDSTAGQPATFMARLPVGLTWNAPHRTASPVCGAGERQQMLLLFLPLLIFTFWLGVTHATHAPRGLVDIAALAPPLPSSSWPPQLVPAPAPAQPLPNAIGAISPPLATPLPTVDVAGIPPIPIPDSQPAPALPPTVIVPTTPPAPPVLAVPEVFPSVAEALAPPTHAPNYEVCAPVPKRVALTTPPAAADFGVQLAQAAQAQTRDFVIYSATYRRIAYPMGDIPSLYGSCSDVVIRAYRALGVDLQELVQRARVGRGDPNIDHRRTETLRAFFARHGQEIAPSAYAEDYKPGDIVTYYRPFSRVSRAHIAVVSDIIGASGRPLIVHNRGWGPQLEDALFVDRITGHYRFTGAPHLMAIAGRVADSNAAASRVAATPISRPPGGLPAPRRADLSLRLR